MRTILLLAISNIFMTYAWYGHLKYGHACPVESGGGLVAHCLHRVLFRRPANRLGFGEFSGFQLKILQEAITLIVFVGFA